MAARHPGSLRGHSLSEARDLRWARRLDPLAVTPFVVESELASTRTESIAALRRAVELEPGSASNWYLLGREELEAKRMMQARRDLLVAQRLDPRDSLIAEALAQTRTRHRGKVR